MLPILVARDALPGPLFQLQDRTPLTKDYFIQKFRAALTNIALEASQYAGHSFRIGAATTAAEKGIEDSLIKVMGRWKSQAYLTYIKTAPDTLAKVSSSLSHLPTHSVLCLEQNQIGGAGMLANCKTTQIGRMTMVTLGGVKASPSIVIASPSPINPISEKLWYTVIVT